MTGTEKTFLMLGFGGLALYIITRPASPMVATLPVPDLLQSPVIMPVQPATAPKSSGGGSSIGSTIAAILPTVLAAL